MRSSKSRSRSKNNRNRPSGSNVINRVFDSSGPEGKVRGTPQQIIEKYNQLARDAQLANDRVATENFQQHAEHYLRLLAEAQREIDARREEQERQNRERQAERDRERAERQERESNAGGAAAGEGEQPDVSFDVADASNSDESDSNLVETPENRAAANSDPSQEPDSAEAEKPKRKPRAPRKPSAPRSRKPKATDEAKDAAKDGDKDSAQAAE